ncbi:MAG TPA: hypothetical protein VGU71_03810 [Candidatus Dormibacteraeota bacterium]|nr:hypothetical protein [Candidatus Dormibacteraeota bacterium]
MDRADLGGLSRRKMRAVAWAAAAAIVIIVAAVVYLRPASPAFTPVAAPTVKPGEATANFVMYDFPSPTVGWAMGFTDGSSGFSVSLTIDGGKNWQRRLTSGQVPSAPLLIRFFNDKRGFVAGGAQLRRTSDGGASWKSLSLPDPRPSYMDFRDDRHGWLMVPVGVDAGQHAHVYSTNDAGDTWQALPDTPADTSFFAFRRASEVWIASSGPEQPHVYRSTDGGLSWQRHEIPFPDRDPSTSTIGSWNTFLTLLPGEGVLASTFCLCPANDSFQSASFDGGATWRLVPFAPFIGSSTARPAVAYQDDVHWWFVYGGALYRSSDAGQTWTKAADRLPDGEFIPRAIDMKHAWAQVRGFDGYGLATTNDAGAHWTRVTTPQLT